MLFIVSTPIGHPRDISLRALDVLTGADVIIGEERRIASTLLKKLQIPEKPLYLLNEHSRDDDLRELTELCRTQKVALISDCGTPSFYDPGYQLVRQCRREGIAVSSVPGASSLMTLLSLVSEPVNSFYFAGFLPAETEARRSHLRQLCLKAEALVLMDTPYRLHKLLQELGELCANRRLLLGLNLTQEQELLIEGSPETLLGALKTKNIEKAEFILLVYANTGEKSRAHVSTSLHRRNDRDRRHSGSSKSNSLRPRRGRS